MKKLLLLLFVTTALSSCKPGWKTQEVPLSFNEAISGVWMPKAEAEELRSKGTLESRCADILEKPNSPMMNTRLILENGDIFAYHPDTNTREEFRMGKIRSDGVLIYSGTFTEFATDYKSIRVAIAGDVLTMTYESDSATAFKAVYLRSSEKETNQNLAAQKACLR